MRKTLKYGRMYGKRFKHQVLGLYTRHNFCIGPFDFIFTQLLHLVVSCAQKPKFMTILRNSILLETK